MLPARLAAVWGQMSVRSTRDLSESANSQQVCWQVMTSVLLLLQVTLYEIVVNSPHCQPGQLWYRPLRLHGQLTRNVRCHCSTASVP
mgnify:CR=1 FL=1